MYMDRLIVKGGYGEHGGAAFWYPSLRGGIICWTAESWTRTKTPGPEVEAELLERTEYLFLSHCHKDHSGAFSRLVSRGFRGWLVAAGATVELARIRYNKVIQADPLSAWPHGAGAGSAFFLRKERTLRWRPLVSYMGFGKSCFYSGIISPDHWHLPWTR